MAHTKFDLVKDSMKIASGLPYQDTVRLTAEVVTEETNPRDRAAQVKNGVRTISIIVGRDAGSSWNRIPRKVELNLGYEEKRYSPVTRITTVRGLREQAIAKAEELWETFKPTPAQIAKMAKGDYDLSAQSSVYEHGEGRYVTIKIKRLPFGDFKLDAREFNVHVTVDPYVDDLEDDSIRPDVRVRGGLSGIFYMPDASNDRQFVNGQSVTESNVQAILAYISPMLTRAVKRHAQELAAQQQAALTKEVRETEEMIKRLKDDLRSAEESLVMRRTSAANFKARVEAKNQAK